MTSKSKPHVKAPEPAPHPTHRDPLDEALEETFPASDSVQPSPRERLVPADPPGSDVEGEGPTKKRAAKGKR